MKAMITRVLVAMVGLAFTVQAARAEVIVVPDVVINFDNDVPGNPPLTGGPGQPSFLLAGAGTTILVQSAAHGITTQPVVETHTAPNQFSTVGFVFPSVASGVVRVEATVSLGAAVNSFFLQTGVSALGAVATRFHALADGQITDFFGTPVGAYVAVQPFRVRMDIDMTADTWSAAVDNELNGFADDPVTSNLPFVNPVSVVPSLGAVNASFAIFAGQPATSIAYDNIGAAPPAALPEPSTLTLLGLGALSLLCHSWRRRKRGGALVGVTE